MFHSVFQSFYTKKTKRDSNEEKEEEDISSLGNRLKRIKLSTECDFRIADTYRKKCVYRHDNIQVVFNRMKNQFKLVATQFIPKGTLLCIEEAFIGSGAYLLTILKHNTDIAKELYPRDKDEFTTPSTLLQYTTTNLLHKINHNAWDWYSEKTDPLSMQSTYGLCPYISKCNHSCTPNAFTLRITNMRNIPDEYTGGFVLYAVEDVREKEEITISYGDTVGHLIESSSVFMWECNCGLSFSERCERLDTHLEMCRRWWTQDKEALDFYI